MATAPSRQGWSTESRVLCRPPGCPGQRPGQSRNLEYHNVSAPTTGARGRSRSPWQSRDSDAIPWPRARSAQPEYGPPGAEPSTLWPGRPRAGAPTSATVQVRLRVGLGTRKPEGLTLTRGGRTSTASSGPKAQPITARHVSASPSHWHRGAERSTQAGIASDLNSEVEWSSHGCRGLPRNPALQLGTAAWSSGIFGLAI